MKTHKHIAALVASTLPLVFIGDILIFGIMVTCMGIYFQNLSTIGFGIYDLVLAALLAKANVDNE